MDPVSHLFRLFASGVLLGYKCHWVNVLGTDIELNYPSVDPYPIAYVSKTHAESYGSRCLFVRRDLSANEQATNIPSYPSLATLMLFRGKNFTKNTEFLRSFIPILFLETFADNRQWLHLFCPKLNSKGTWQKNIAVWSGRRQHFLPDLTQNWMRLSCRHPLRKASLRAAAAQRSQMSLLTNGKWRGVEVDLVNALQQKYNFELEYFSATHGNLGQSELEQSGSESTMQR